MLKFLKFDFVFATAIASRPPFKGLHLVLWHFGSPREDLVIDVEHHVHFLIDLDLHSLRAQLAVLLAKVVPLGHRQVLHVIKLSVPYFLSKRIGA